MASRKRARSSWLAPMLGSVGSFAASYYAGPQYAAAGRRIGMSLGQGFKDITGYGDYTVNRNVLVGVPSVGNPVYHPNALTISHKEYIGDVITSNTANDFKMHKYELNPSNSQLWEFLAQIANNFEEWIPEGIIFYYKSTSGDALSSTNTALGTVIMASLYNPYAADFNNKADMTTTEFCSNGNPAEDLMHPIECDPSQGSIAQYFISQLNYNPSTKFNSQDKRFSTLCNFFIATTGFQGTSVNIGELWVSYQVSLLKPRLFTSLGLALDYFHAVQNQGQATNNTAAGLCNWLINTTDSPAPEISSSSNMPFSGTDLVPRGKLNFWSSPGVGKLTIAFPVYPFPTQYQISFLQICDAAAPVGSMTATYSSGTYPVAYTPIQISKLQVTDDTVGEPSSTIFTIVVRVPGGFIPHLANTPHVVIYQPGVVTNYTWDLEISQLPYNPSEFYFPFVEAGS